MADQGILALIGGLASGLTRGAQHRQKQKMDEEYKKALIDQAKTQAKMKEQEINLHWLKYQQEQESTDFLKKMIQGGGQSGPAGTPFPGGAPAPGPMGAITGGQTYGNVQQQMGGGVIPQARAEQMAGAPYPTQTQPGNIDFIQMTMNHLTQAGLPPVAAAGIAGNLLHESGANPEAVGDGGSSFGLAQWNGPRRKALEQFAAQQGANISDPKVQLNFLIAELQRDYPQVAEKLRNVKTPQEAAVIFSQEYERPGKPMLESRVNYANQAMQSFTPVSDNSGRTPIDMNNPYFRALFKKQFFGVDPKGQIDVKGDGFGNFLIFENGQLKGKVQGHPGYESYDAQHPTTGAPMRATRPKPTPDQPYPMPIYEPTGPTIQTKSQLEGYGKKAQDEITGLSPEVAGKSNALNMAVRRLEEVNKMVFNPDNTLNKDIIAKANAPFGGIGPGRSLYSKMRQVVSAVLRVESGATVTKEDIDDKMAAFWPKFFDLQNPETIHEKMKDLNEYVNSVVMLNKGGSKEQTQGINNPMTNQQKSSQGWIENGIKYRINPKTGKKEMWRD